MIDPTAELSIALEAGGALTYSSEIVEMNEPVLFPRTEYATSGNLDGAIALRSTWENANLNALLRLEGTTAADLDSKRTALEAAVAQFTTSVTQTINGVARTYTTEGRGQMRQAAGAHTFENLSHFTESYEISLPVYPVGA